MSVVRHGWLTLLITACLALPGAAEPNSADPLRLVPAKSDFILKVDQPRRLVDVVLALDAVQGLKKLDFIREAYESTKARRLYQLIAHFENKMEMGQDVLFDRLAGGGVVLAIGFAEPPLALLVLQGKDPKTMQRFVRLAEETVAEELTRQESKQRVEKGTYRGIERLNLGKELHVAVVGAALLVSNSVKVVEAAIDAQLDGGAKSFRESGAWSESKKLLGDEPLGTFWVNLESARGAPQLKVLIDTFTAEPASALVLGGIGDLIRRSPFVCAGLSQQPAGFALDLRFPRGRDGMSEAALAVVPEHGSGSLPLLQPKNVQISMSYYLDLAKVWENRAKLLDKEKLKGLEDADAKSGLFLGGRKLSTLLSQTGPHQRFVYVQQDHSTVYKKVPKQRVAAFGVVQEVRDPAFGKSMEFILRSAALLGAFQFNLKLAEETHEGVKIVGYRFPEDGKYKGDLDNTRYSFSPCFGQVGNQFFTSSTIELGRELVGLLKNEADVKADISSTSRIQLYSAGLASQLRTAQEDMITRAVLAQAATPEDARKQTDAVVGLVDGLGILQVETNYGRKDTRIRLRVHLGKEPSKGN